MEKQSAFLLKVSDGQELPNYTTLAGLRTKRLLIEDKSVSVSGQGVFTGSAAELRIKGYALSGVLEDYELSFDSGECLRGRFLITRLDYAGDFNGERSYAMALESAGKVVAL